MGRHSRTGHMTSCTGIEFENLATLKGYSAPTRQFDWVSRNGCFRRYFAVGARVGEGPESRRVSDAGPSTSGRSGIRPASESLGRKNPRESGERWTVYGNLSRQRRCRQTVL